MVLIKANKNVHQIMCASTNMSKYKTAHLTFYINQITSSVYVSKCWRYIHCGNYTKNLKSVLNQ